MNQSITEDGQLTDIVTLEFKETPAHKKIKAIPRSGRHWAFSGI